MCMRICKYTACMPDVEGGQKKAPYSLELSCGWL